MMIEKLEARVEASLIGSRGNKGLFNVLRNK